MNQISRRGFTIVELLVVIAVIGILATIVVVGYGAWRHSTTESKVKSDLNGVAAAMENARTFGTAYPVALPTTISHSDGVVLSGGGSADGKTYCVDAVSTDDPAITFYIDSSSGSKGAQPGTCASRSGEIVLPVPSLAVTAQTTQLNLTWAAVAGATSYSAQCATDAAFIINLAQTSSTTTNASLSGLQALTSYFCRVRASNGSGNGGWSATVSAATTTVVTTLAGSASGFADGTGTSAQFAGPSGVAVDASGTVYVADSGNNRIRKITPAGVVTTLAGSTRGSADGTGTSAQFYAPSGVAVDASGTVYVVDNGNNRTRKITPAGVVTTLAGSTYGFADGTGSSAQFAGPSSVAVDASGTVYVADSGNNRTRKITPAGLVTTLAGSASGFADGTGASAQFSGPYGVAVDASGTVYVADYGNNRIRKITPAAVVTTLAGSTRGSADGTGTSAQFYAPSSVAVDASGTVYVADYANNRIRMIK